MKASFFTFGCKLNQCETEALADSFEKQGFEIVDFDTPAQVFIVNTCTVTSKSEQKARRVIRKASREYPDSLVLVTGCYAQLEPELIGELGDNVLSVPLDQKDLIMDLSAYLGHELAPGENLYKQAGFWLETQAPGIDSSQSRFRFSAADFNFHARAFLKIQDGCDHRCAYCRVCLARGASVSLDSATVIARLKELEASGSREIVLTGVNIDSYRDGHLDLSGLLELIIEETDSFRIRLSSLEPETLLSRDLSILSHPRICPHFHISAQSGSDTVLQRMNRPYISSSIRDAVQKLRQLKDDPFIAADLIAGFPGETEKEHRETLNLVEELGFTRIHVFPFSPRPGTAAWDMTPKVPERVSGERTRELRQASSRFQEEYFNRWLNRTVQVLLEEKKSLQEKEYWEGTSENYLKVRIPASLIPGEEDAVRGGVFSCTITSHQDFICYGNIVSSQTENC